LSQMEDAGEIIYAVECVADGVCTGAGGSCLPPPFDIPTRAMYSYQIAHTVMTTFVSTII
jgi:hypothetical protein